MAILEVVHVSKEFGGLPALSDVSFAIQRGEIKGLIGPNGAGKTTLFNVATGFVAPTRGKVLFEGNNLTNHRPHEIVRRGVVRTFQLPQLFPDMTVLENVMVGRHVHSRAEFVASLLCLPGQRREEKDIRTRSEEVLALTGLGDLARAMVANLPYGLQRRVELARALAADPQLILLDEPAAGLNSQESLELIDLLRQINQRGVTILLVEHDVGLVMELCHSLVVLNYGEVIAEGGGAEIRANPQVMAAYLGEELDHA
ncbi:MAG: ABC transporter ATP-binding protein [Chloroflexota bacterium]|nr:MAG: ABC transporter ATP-binding protein [Chloroflexota bacterium]